MSESYDIYMTGVGGQGIGLLAEALARAVDRAGLSVRGCDTHGLAQRGGIVSSHLRIGASAHSPLVSPGRADLVIALEGQTCRHEPSPMQRSFETTTARPPTSWKLGQPKLDTQTWASVQACGSTRTKRAVQPGRRRASRVSLSMQGCLAMGIDLESLFRDRLLHHLLQLGLLVGIDLAGTATPGLRGRRARRL